MNTKNIQKSNHHRAVVIGGSLAGLLAARVLSSHFKSVTIVERDAVSDNPESRKGQRHTMHTHVLLAKGLQVLNDFFPDLISGLCEQGAKVIDFTNEAQWYVAGGINKRHKSKFNYLLCSRPLLEAAIRKQVLAFENVELVDNTSCNKLVFDHSGTAVVGLEIESRGLQNRKSTIKSDLIVDASGRGSKAGKWLKQAGYQPPFEQKIEIDVSYSTRIYRRRADSNHDGGLILVQPIGPKEFKGGCLVPIENDRWICTLSGWGGHHATNEHSSFMKFAAELPASALYDSIRALEPETDIITYKYPASRWLRYDKLKNSPAGFLVMGDAVCSFNPIFGQGMTSTACQAEILNHTIANRTHPKKLASRFYKKSAQVINRAWQTAASADFQFPTTTGKKPIGTNLANRFVHQVQKACHTSQTVYRAYLRVTNLLASPSSLFRPGILGLVVLNRLKAVFSSA